MNRASGVVSVRRGACSCGTSRPVGRSGNTLVVDPPRVLVSEQIGGDHGASTVVVDGTVLPAGSGRTVPPVPCRWACRGGLDRDP